MKLGFTCVSIVLLFFLAPSLGFSQTNIKSESANPKKIKLVSPLDLLYKMPDAKTTKSIKQRSIFDANKLPIFCKIEHKLAKSSNVNLRMRLGSLDYVNKLEGKN